MGWAFVLVFGVCGAIRLARFNVSIQPGNSNKSKLRDMFFTGVNAPLGAILAVTPMILSFEFTQFDSIIKNPWIVGGYMVSIAFAMASRIPTFSIKKISISPDNVALTLAFFGLLIAALIIEPWLVIACVAILYILSIPVSVVVYYMRYRSL